MIKIGAFTIIELLVSISILLLIVGLTLVGFSRYEQRQKVVSAGQTIKNTIRDVQSRSYNGELDCNFCDCDVSSSYSLQGWAIDFSSSQIYGICRSQIPPYPTVTFSPNRVSLPDQITVLAQPTGVFFRYYPPGVSTSVHLCVSKNSADGYYVIDVNQAGVITDSSGIIPQCN